MHACNDDTHPLAWDDASRHEGPLASVARALRRIFEAGSRGYAARRATETLLSMDDHLLRDIGVSRADVARIMLDGRRPEDFAGR